MLTSLLTETARSGSGFHWINLAILGVLIAVGFPLLQRTRRRARAARRARWAREDLERLGRTRDIPEPQDPRELPDPGGPDDGTSSGPDGSPRT